MDGVSTVLCTGSKTCALIGLVVVPLVGIDGRPGVRLRKSSLAVECFGTRCGVAIALARTPPRNLVIRRGRVRTAGMLRRWAVPRWNRLVPKGEEH